MNNIESIELTLSMIRQTCKQIVDPTKQKDTNMSYGKKRVIGECKEVAGSFPKALQKKHQDSFVRVYNVCIILRLCLCAVAYGYD